MELDYKKSPMGIEIDIKAAKYLIKGDYSEYDQDELINNLCRWASTIQGHGFWENEQYTGLSEKGRNILIQQIKFHEQKGRLTIKELLMEDG